MHFRKSELSYICQRNQFHNYTKRKKITTNSSKFFQTFKEGTIRYKLRLGQRKLDPLPHMLFQSQSTSSSLVTKSNTALCLSLLIFYIIFLSCLNSHYTVLSPLQNHSPPYCRRVFSHPCSLGFWNFVSFISTELISYLRFQLHYFSSTVQASFYSLSFWNLLLSCV